MIRIPSLAVAAALALSSCGAPSMTEGVTRARARSTGLFGMSSPDAVKTAGTSAFKGADRVVVGSFIVGFSTYDTMSRQSGRFSSNARNTLVGVDESQMRQITDAAHDRFAQALRTAGYTVVDPARLLADTAYSATKSYPNPYVDTSGGLFGSRSSITYVGQGGAPMMKIYAGAIQGTTGGFGPDNPTYKAMDFAQANGTRVLNVVYVLNFVGDARPAGLQLTNAAVVGQGLSVVADASKLGIYGASNGTLSLGQPLTSDKAFATLSDATTGGARAGEEAVNALTSLMGNGASQSRNFSFVARPADYAAAAQDAMDQANAKLIATMTGLR